MPERLNRLLLTGLAILALAALAVLILERAPSRRLPGYWIARYEHGQELLILYRDGRYTQQVTIRNGGVYTVRGTWRTEGADKQWLLMLSGAYDPISPDGCDLEAPPHQGERDLHAVRDWFTLYLEPCAGDPQHRFEKLAGNPGQSILLR
jgi:hypothetical protein